MTESITIVETTVAEVADIRVGLANVWDEDYENAAGEVVHGVRGTLSFMGPTPETDFDQRVAVGDTVTIGERTFEVTRVHEPPNGLGAVTLRG